MKNKSPENSA